MAGPIDHLEQLLERALESPARRLFRTRLQPVELARALGRAMEGEAMVGPAGLIAPSHYLLELNPADLQELVNWQPSIEHELVQFVRQHAQQRGWLCPVPCVVQIVSAPDVARGRPRAVAHAPGRDGADAAASPAGTAVEPLERTTALPPMKIVPGSAPPVASEAGLELPDGRLIPMVGPHVRLGRAPDNDIVLGHASVSRYHALIQRGPSGFRLVDLGSHNGTRVGDVAVRERDLQIGDVITLGAVPLHFRSR